VAVQRKAVDVLESEQRVGRLLIRVAREIRTMVDRTVEPLGLTMQQAELLVWVSLGRDASPGQLGELLLTDEAGVSRLVDRLETKGLMRRGRGRDRRSRGLELTPSGRALAARLRRFAAAGNDRLLAGFSPNEVAQLRRLLQRVSDNATNPPGVPR
jgi:DNA-binding MarR family transcriptional regulator